MLCLHAGKGKLAAQRDTELEHRRQVPVPTERQPSLVAGGVKAKAAQSRYQLAESQPCSQEVSPQCSLMLHSTMIPQRLTFALQHLQTRVMHRQCKV